VRVIRLEAAVFDEPTGDWMRPSRAAADDSHRFRSLASDEAGVADEAVDHGGGNDRVGKQFAPAICNWLMFVRGYWACELR
jgi:hypothetical protein